MPVVTRAAVAFEPNAPLRMADVTVADPGPGEVMVRILATGLCHSDLLVLEGKVPLAFPIILGHEGIGDVVEIGEGVSDFQPGDRVMPFLVPDCGVCPFCRSGRTNLCVQFGLRRAAPASPFTLDGKPVASLLGLGTFAETTVVAADMLTKISPAARTDQACCIACGVTTGLGAALIATKVTPGSTVAVFGAGGVGLSVVQGARIASAGRIIVVDTNPARESVARALGATDFVNPKEQGDIVAHIHGLTGLGADFAFECVGLPGLVRQALECTNPAWGITTCLGILPAEEELSAGPMVLSAGRRWTGSLMGGAKRQDVARFVDMYVAGEVDLDHVVSHRLRLSEINSGFDMMRSGEAVRSVVVYEA